MYSNIKSVSLCLFLIIIIHTVVAQKTSQTGIRVALDFGSIKTTGLNKSIDNNLSLSTGITVEKPFYISRGIYFIMGAGFYEQLYFVDGYFEKQGNATTFQQVANGTINNKLEFFGLKIPLMFSFPLFSKDKRAIALSAGADIDLFLTGTRKYKMFNENKVVQKFSINNKIQIPLRLEVSTLNLAKPKSTDLFYGFGIRQQVSNYLKSNSFKPLEMYFRLGVQF